MLTARSQIKAFVEFRELSGFLERWANRRWIHHQTVFWNLDFLKESVSEPLLLIYNLLYWINNKTYDFTSWNHQKLTNGSPLIYFTCWFENFYDTLNKQTIIEKVYACWYRKLASLNNYCVLCLEYFKNVRNISKNQMHLSFGFIYDPVTILSILRGQKSDLTP